MGLDDREALATLRAAVDPQAGSDELIHRFYTRWFAVDIPVRDLFPPDMSHQRDVFATALTWLFGELIAQRAEEPVAFLAQLGRDHRKYGVTQRHYDSMQDALLDHAAQPPDRSVGRPAGRHRRAGRRTDRRGHARCGRRREGAALRRRQRLEHMRATRDVSVIRLQLDDAAATSTRPVRHRAGAAVAAPLAVSEPVDPRRPRRRHRVPRPFGAPAAWSAPPSSARPSPGDRWRLSNPHGAMHVDRDGGDVLMVAGGTGLAPLRSIIMNLARWGPNPRVHLFFGARYPCDLYDLKTLWQVAVDQPVAVGDPGVGILHQSAVGRRLSQRRASARAARSPNRHAPRGGDAVRQLGRPADPGLRRTAMVAADHGRP